MPNPSATSRIPMYRLHKPTGLGVVRPDGRDHYLGKHKTPESEAAYRRLIAEWLVSHGVAPEPGDQGHPETREARCVNELVLAYLDFARSYYTRNGRSTGEYENVSYALRP